MINWPENKKFAFTVVDDTDCATLKNVPVLYDFLNECGLKTTKSVWIFDGEKRTDNANIIGASCEDKAYLKWLQNLNSQGFEIALHSSSWSSSNRERVKNAFKFFYEYFGHNPDILVQHCDNKDCEAIYWGENRVSSLIKLFYKFILRMEGKRRNIYLGEDKESEYFWGDICNEKIKYVRNFVFNEINTLKACPYMPYHDSKRPYVNFWFASTEAPDIDSFNKCLAKENQDKLERQGGACIIYTHFGNGFVQNGKLNSRFKMLIENLSQKNGWFVPATKILDFINDNKTNPKKNISNLERTILELRWLKHKLKIGTS